MNDIVLLTRRLFLQDHINRQNNEEKASSPLVGELVNSAKHFLVFLFTPREQ